MKIAFTGGGTGGHFYPIIAIAEQVNKVIDEEKIVEAKLYYISDTPYDKKALYDNGIIYRSVEAGKLRVYFSLANFFDIFKTGIGVIKALILLYGIFPDVVVGKGGYASFPALLAARILGIPVFIHESDTYPGRVNRWAGKFAKRIAVSFPEAAQYFPADKTAFIGQPIRQEIKQRAKDGVFDFFGFDATLPTIFVIGGSSGAEVINNAMLDALPLLVDKYQIIHMTGPKNFEEVQRTAELIIGENPNKARYKPMPFLNILELRMAAGAASLIISRGGSMLFEIASWGVPSIIIPITVSNGDHQRKNAYSYARAGGCEVLEEANLTASVLAGDVHDLLSNPAILEKMKKGAETFSTRDAAHAIAKEIISIALSHEK